MLLSEVVLAPLEILLRTVYLYYLTDSYCLTIITDSNLNFKSPSNIFCIYYNETGNLRNQLLVATEMGCSDYIVHINDTETFMKAFDSVSLLANTRRSDRKIIFLPTEERNGNSLLNIFTMIEASYVPNIVIVLPVKDTSEGCEVYDLVTHKFIGNDDSVNQPLYLDQWNSCDEKFNKNKNLFPYDMSKLQGKSLKLACFTYKPYSILDLSPEKAPLQRDGTEVRVIDEFCRWINCTVQIVRDDINQWGVIFDNRTGNGVMGNILEDHADLGIAALYSWYDSFLVMDFSMPTVRTAITCLVPVPRLLDSWDKPLLPFTLLVWVAVIFTFIFSVAAFSFAQGSTDRAVLSTFGMLIMQTQDNVEGSWRIRSVSVWLLIAGLVLDNAYGAGLAATFMVPRYEPSIDTIQDLVDRNLGWGATADAWIFSLSLSTDPKLQKLTSQFQIYSEEELEEKTFDRSLAFAIEKLPSGYYAIGDYITREGVPNLMIMLEDIYFEQCVVMLRKSSPYTQKLNQFIGRLHQSGLLLVWETQYSVQILQEYNNITIKQVAMKHLDFKVQIEVNLSRSKRNTVPIVALTFHHVVGIFSIYLVGIAISVLVFLAELCVGRKQRETISNQRQSTKKIIVN